MGTEDPALVFIPEGLGRPTAEVLDALIYALWESWFAPGDARIRGAIAAAQWLGQVRRHGPVSGEDRAPVRLAVVNEHDLALPWCSGCRTRTARSTHAWRRASPICWLSPWARPTTSRCRSSTGTYRRAQREHAARPTGLPSAFRRRSRINLGRP